MKKLLLFLLAFFVAVPVFAVMIPDQPQCETGYHFEGRWISPTSETGECILWSEEECIEWSDPECMNWSEPICTNWGPWHCPSGSVKWKNRCFMNWHEVSKVRDCLSWSEPQCTDWSDPECLSYCAPSCLEYDQIETEGYWDGECVENEPEPTPEPEPQFVGGGNGPLCVLNGTCPCFGLQNAFLENCLAYHEDKPTQQELDELQGMINKIREMLDTLQQAFQLLMTSKG